MVECRDNWRGFGKSLIELLEDPKAPHHDAVFSEVSTKAYSTSGVPVSATMIRDEQYKMIVDRTGTPLELYDLEKDPDEMTNLVGKKDLEKTISHLKHRMLQWYLGTQKIQDKSEIPQV
jgi:arylsulfatase A-like enzyme